MVAAAGAVVFGSHLGIGGAYANNGLSAETRAYTAFTKIITPVIDVHATGTPLVLAFADSNSGTRFSLSVAGLGDPEQRRQHRDRGAGRRHRAARRGRRSRAGDRPADRVRHGGRQVGERLEHRGAAWP